MIILYNNNMTYEQFAQHVQKNGITLARTTKDFKKIPKGTKLWFCLDGEYISTYDDYTENKNKELGYEFDYRWSHFWKDKYTGQFELVGNKLNNTPNEPCVAKGNKIMSIITNAFKSKEDKALEYFGLGTEKDLNADGRHEFVQFLFQTLTAERKAFLAKMVDAYKDEKK